MWKEIAHIEDTLGFRVLWKDEDRYYACSFTGDSGYLDIIEPHGGAGLYLPGSVVMLAKHAGIRYRDWYLIHSVSCRTPSYEIVARNPYSYFLGHFL